MWQFFGGIGIPGFQLIIKSWRLDYKTWRAFSLGWLWGSQLPEYDIVARKAIELLDGPVDEVPSKETVDELIRFSNVIKDEAIAGGRYNFRWNGLLRYFDVNMNYDTVKFEKKDIFANQCKACGTQHNLRADWRKCYTCGVTRPLEDCEVSRESDSSC